MFDELATLSQLPVVSVDRWLLIQIWKLANQKLKKLSSALLNAMHLVCSSSLVSGLDWNGAKTNAFPNFWRYSRAQVMGNLQFPIQAHPLKIWSTKMNRPKRCRVLEREDRPRKRPSTNRWNLLVLINQTESNDASTQQTVDQSAQVSVQDMNLWSPD